jgi:hypothetical protein
MAERRAADDDADASGPSQDSCAVAIAPPQRRSDTSLFPDETKLIHSSLCGPTINPYRRCDIRCSYCVNGAQGPSVPVVEPGRVEHQLHTELRDVPTDELLGVGTVIDAYPNADRELAVARDVVRVLVGLGRRFVVVTKNTLIRRDLDLLSGSTGRVVVSVSTLDERAAARIEQGAPPPSARLAVVDELARAGVDVSVSIAPWIPELTDVNAIVALVDPAIPVSVAPLNVEWYTSNGGPTARGWTQAMIDGAYLAEVERVGTAPNVGWYSPPTARKAVFAAVATGERWRRHAFTGEHPATSTA